MNSYNTNSEEPVPFWSRTFLGIAYWLIALILVALLAYWLVSKYKPSFTDLTNPRGTFTFTQPNLLATTRVSPVSAGLPF